MKTQLTTLAGILLALTAYSPALAGPKYTPHFDSDGTSAPKVADCCMSDQRCHKAPTCCDTKNVNLTPNGKTPTIQVRTCKANCPVGTDQQRAVCNRGRQAN